MNKVELFIHKHHLFNSYDPGVKMSWWMSTHGDLILRRQYFCKKCGEADKPEVMLIATAEQIEEAKQRDRVDLTPDDGESK